MARLLPSLPDTSTVEESSPRIVGLDDENAEALLSALSSTTARQVLDALHEEPRNPSALADAVDTSLQNVQYHLERLESAGLIEVIDTAYSEKGREMNVYAPADRPLVVFAGGEEERSGLRTALSSLLGGVALVALLAALVQWFVGRGATGGSVRTLAASPPPTAGGLPPGFLFFLGGLCVLLVGFAFWYVRYR